MDIRFFLISENLVCSPQDWVNELAAQRLQECLSEENKSFTFAESGMEASGWKKDGALDLQTFFGKSKSQAQV